MKNILMWTPAMLLLLTGFVQAAEQDNLSAAVKSNNSFAVDLYSRLSKQEGNNFFSPYSIATAFGMTWVGAKGETETEIGKVFRFDLGQNAQHDASAQLIKYLKGDKARKFELTTANAMWAQKGYGFLDNFIKTVQNNYGAGFIEVDYKTNAEGARKTINEWVEKETQTRIKDLLPSGILDSNTRLVLTNAVYFKAGWESTFNKNATRDGDFHVSADKKVSVPMMLQTTRFPMRSEETFHVVELPYRDKELSMILLVPKKVNGLADLEKQLSAEKLQKLTDKLTAEKVMLSMPKFELSSQFKLNDTLSAMGMPLAFDIDKADFSGMNGKKNLYLTAAMHKTFVKVDEEGTEAAGATAVVAGEKSIPPSIKVDRPFLFFVRENKTGCILFMGRVVKPVN